MPNHSHFIMVPTTGTGALVDPVNLRPALQSAMKPPFDFSDVFLYSHGWWTTADRAMDEYTRFSIGLAGVMLQEPRLPAASLGIGIHWPSMLSEESGSLLNKFEFLTYYNRAMMADHIGAEGGYAILRLMLETRKQDGLAAPRLHFLGHSFGCKVVCSILQTLASSASAAVLKDVPVDLVLLQAAFDCDGLGPGGAYQDVVKKVPNLRILVTKSQQDKALTQLFREAGLLDLIHPDRKRALGDAGPDDGLIERMGGKTDVSVDSGFTTAPGLNARLVVADLTPLHQHDGYAADELTGHHSDIFQPEVYRLIAGFLRAST